MWYLSALDLLGPSEKGLPHANDNIIATVLTDAFVLLGAISVLMIVIAGLRYILARGNTETITQAKNQIIYSITGLIIAALAASIVQVVLKRAG
jgi:hypothetical protein